MLLLTFLQLGQELHVHLELVVVEMTGVGRALTTSLNFAPAIALILLMVDLGLISAVHLILMIVMVERAVVVLHEMAGNIFRRCMSQR